MVLPKYVCTVHTVHTPRWKNVFDSRNQKSEGGKETNPPPFLNSCGGWGGERWWCGLGWVGLWMSESSFLPPLPPPGVGGGEREREREVIYNKDVCTLVWFLESSWTHNTYTWCDTYVSDLRHQTSDIMWRFTSKSCKRKIYVLFLLPLSLPLSLLHSLHTYVHTCTTRSYTTLRYTTTPPSPSPVYNTCHTIHIHTYVRNRIEMW